MSIRHFLVLLTIVLKFPTGHKSGGRWILGEGKNECQGRKSIAMTILYKDRVAHYNAHAHQGLWMVRGLRT